MQFFSWLQRIWFQRTGVEAAGTVDPGEAPQRSSGWIQSWIPSRMAAPVHAASPMHSATTGRLRGDTATGSLSIDARTAS
jgi:hypothetical protein